MTWREDFEVLRWKALDGTACPDAVDLAADNAALRYFAEALIVELQEAMVVKPADGSDVSLEVAAFVGSALLQHLDRRVDVLWAEAKKKAQP